MIKKGFTKSAALGVTLGAGVAPWVGPKFKYSKFAPSYFNNIQIYTSGAILSRI